MEDGGLGGEGALSTLSCTLDAREEIEGRRGDAKRGRRREKKEEGSASLTSYSDAGQVSAQALPASTVTLMQSQRFLTAFSIFPPSFHRKSEPGHSLHPFMPVEAGVLAGFGVAGVGCGFAKGGEDEDREGCGGERKEERAQRKPLALLNLHRRSTPTYATVEESRLAETRRQWRSTGKKRGGRARNDAANPVVVDRLSGGLETVKRRFSTRVEVNRREETHLDCRRTPTTLVSRDDVLLPIPVLPHPRRLVRYFLHRPDHLLHE